MTKTEHRALEAVVLEGRHVRLEPLSPEHFDGLAGAGLYPELWRWTTTCPRTREDLLEYLRNALEES